MKKLLFNLYNRFDLKTNLLFAMAFLLMPMSVFAQIKVTGSVIDDLGEVVGASVIVKETGQGTVTNLSGAYSIDVPNENATLQFSFIGYQTQEIKVGNQSVINVKLQENAQLLDDVVVLGFSVQTRKADLSTSVGVLENLETNKARPVANAESMLQGQIAGVTVVNNGGDPTSTPSINIRGMGSQSNESALWVVDGVPGAPFNINDVESIVVLKDAASAAIYGAQSGSAGVIMVTTKKAKSGAPTVTYQGSVGFSQATNKPQSLTTDQQRSVREQAYAVNGATLSSAWYSDEMSQTKTDWVNEIFRTGLFQRHYAAVSGGTENFANSISFNYNNVEGTLLGTYNKTMGLRYNGSAKINKYITINEDLSWSINNKRGTNTDSGYNGVIWNAMSMPRSAAAYYADGSYGGTASQGNAEVAALHGDLINPLRILNAHSLINKTDNLSTTTNLSIHDILPGLRFNSRFTYRAENYFYKRFDPIRPELGKPYLTNSLEYETSSGYFWETENRLTYDNTFGKHTVGALFATTANKQRYRQFGISATGFENENDANQYLNYASNYNIPTDNYLYPDNNVALVARLSYSYNDRYFVTASWRRDYAGRLANGNKSGDFPSITGAWKISNERFFKKSDIISLLKVRASWGRIGNLGAVSYGYSSPTLSLINYPNDGGQVGGTVTSNRYDYRNAVNANLTWETSESLDLGIDINMFKDRLSISADYFSKRTFNLIQAQTMNWPNAIGLNAMLINQGEIKNRGVEVSASWRESINKNWSYFVSGNMTVLNNWVSDIGISNNDGTKGVWSHNNSFRGTLIPFQTAEGQPLYTYYLVKNLGIFQTDEEAASYVDKEGNRIQPSAKAGDLKFEDINGDGKIDSNDRQYMGSYLPKITYALTTGFTYKDLSFSIMLQGAAKSKAFNATKYTFLNEAEGSFNRSVDILNAWPATNNIPRLNSSDPNQNFSLASDWYLEDASYLRIKNVTLSYDFTKLLNNVEYLRTRNGALQAYVSIDNLATFTKYTGIDPEVGGIGLDQGKYPVSRVFSLGLTLTY